MRIGLCEPGDDPLVERIVAERGSLLDLYAVLLHSRPVAEGWLSLLTAVRQRTTLPGAVREMVIVRVAHLNRAGYEAQQHVPLALAEGVSGEQIDALANWQEAGPLFSEREQAALALTDRMTCQVQVDLAVWDRVRSKWSDREIVELVATIAAYNMVSRFLEALEIHAGGSVRQTAL